MVTSSSPRTQGQLSTPSLSKGSDTEMGSQNSQSEDTRMHLYVPLSTKVGQLQNQVKQVSLGKSQRPWPFYTKGGRSSDHGPTLGEQTQSLCGK